MTTIVKVAGWITAVLLSLVIAGISLIYWQWILFMAVVVVIQQLYWQANGKEL